MGTLVSIIIPLYRGAAYLAEAIESCLAQSHEKLEIVVVDDASPDDSRQIAEDYAARGAPIRILINEWNTGVSGAWNTGMEAAKGDYILRLAQDDVLMPETVKELLSLFEQNPPADVAYADGFRLLSNGTMVADRPVASEEELFRSSNRLGLCVMISREIVDAGFRYDRDYRAAEDLEFFTRIFDEGFRFVRYSGPPLMKIRIHDQAGSVVNSARQETETAEILTRRITDPKRRQAIWAEHYGNAIYNLRSRREWKTAARLAIRGLQGAPCSKRLWKQLIATLIRHGP